MLTDKVKKTIKELGMLEKGDSVMLCVSGGVDSFVLLDIFLSIREELDLTLSICHLNHNLRGAESERDQKFVEKAAMDLGLPFYTRTLAQGELEGGEFNGSGGSLQDRAREARYEFFAEAAEKFQASRIALAHNRDDQAETVLMRIIKGASMKGLRGIPEVRGPYIRPLIESTRASIEAYAKENNVEFVEDSSNESTKYLRNQLRLELIPLLEKDYNPAVKDALSSLSASLKRDYAFIEYEAEKLFESARENSNDEGGGLCLSRKLLIDAPEALSTRVFFSAIEEVKGSALDIYAVHVEAFLKLLVSDDPGASLDLPGGLRLRRVYDSVVLDLAADSAPAPDYEVELKVPGITPLGQTGKTFRAEILENIPDPKSAAKDAAFFDLDALIEAGTLDGPVMVRSFRAGDRMTPLGMSGRKKLKDIFVDEKIPRNSRSTVPMLVCGSEVLWAAGIKQSGVAMVTETTRRVLRVELKSDSTKQ